ncbi:MAG: hypothetical protein OHK0037_03310 [Elainellaceae cyanobacterium]
MKTQNSSTQSTHSPAVLRKLALASAIVWSATLPFAARLSANPTGPTTWRVTNNNDSGAGSLRQAIADAAANPGPDVVDLTGVSGVITLNSPLVIAAGNDLQLQDDNNTTLNGQSSVQIMTIGRANVKISGLTFSNGLARGGNGINGGGGGLGAGGALLLDAGSVVSLSNSRFTNNRAVGGDSIILGSATNRHYSGGGSNYNPDGHAGGIGGGLNGSNGPGGGHSGGRSGRNGNTGGKGVDGEFGSGGGGGGGGGAATGRGVAKDSAGSGGPGGNGGYGGGSGGGGGGGEDRDDWSRPDYGGGGPGGTAGAYGGTGESGEAGNTGSKVAGRGGGGAGLGGAIFVREGATLIQDFGITFQGNSVAGGTSYPMFPVEGAESRNGKAAGQNVFYQNGQGDSERSLLLRDNTAAIAPTNLTAQNLTEVANQVVRNPEIVRQLTHFAHALGFAYAAGSRSQHVGEDFEIINTGTAASPSYVLRARYNGTDPFASGLGADKRLSITLSNFQVAIDPGSFRYGTPRSRIGAPIIATSYTATNADPAPGTVRRNLTYSVAEAVLHSTTYKFTQGLKTTLSLQIPFTVDQKTELSISAEQGWTDSRTVTRTITDSSEYSAPISRRSERTIDVVAVQTSSDIDYEAIAKVSFDISYSGTLRSSDNAREDSPNNRPEVTIKLSTDQLEGINNADLSNVTDNHGKRYIENKFLTTYAEYTRSFFKAGILTPLRGTFTNVAGTSVSIVARPERSLDAVLPAIPGNTANPTGAVLSQIFSRPINTLTVLSVPNNAAQGMWQFSSDGTTWQPVQTGQALSGNAWVRFLPAANYRGTPEQLKVKFDVDPERLERLISVTVSGV